MAKTAAEKVAKIDERLAQLNAQKKDILARDREAAKKARNKRLIETGAEVEAALGYALDTPELRKRLGDFLRQQNEKGNWANKAIKGE